MNERVKGYLYAVASAALFGMFPIASKFALAGGATPLNLLVLKGAALLPLGVMAFAGRRVDMRVPRGKEARDVAVLAAMGALLTPLLLLLSYTYIESGAATTLHYAYCVLTLVICVVVYKEKFDFVKGVCVALCVAGVFLIYAPKQAGSLAGVLFALASAVTYAVYTVYLDKSGLHGMSPVKLQFYVLCVSVPLSVAYAAATGALSFKMSAPAWGAALLYSMFGSCLGTLFYQRGVHYIGSQRATILSTMEPLTSALFGAALFAERLSWRSAFGMAAVIAAAVLVAAADSLRERRRRP